MRATPLLHADVGGDALERHDRDGAGLLGDAGLLGVDDVHDHAALEHLGQACLDPASSISSIAVGLLRGARLIGFADAPQEVAQLHALLLVEAVEEEPLDPRHVCLARLAKLRRGRRR